VLVWISSPFVIRSVANQQMAGIGLQLADSSSVRVNPFTFSVSFDAIFIQKENKEVLKLDHAELDISAWEVLTQKTLLLEEVSIKGLSTSIFYSDIAQSHGEKSNKQLVIAGYSLPLEDNTLSSSAPAAPTNSETQNISVPTVKNWAIKSNKLSLNDVSLSLHHNGKPHRLELSDLTLTDLSVIDNQVDVQYTLGAFFNHAHIQTNGLITAGSDQLNIVAQADIANLQLETYQHYLAEHVEKVSGELAVKTQLKLTQKKHDLLLALDSLQLTVNALNTKIQGMHLNADQQQIIIGKNSRIQRSENLTVNIEANYSAADLSITESDTGNLIAQFGSISIPSIATIFEKGIGSGSEKSIASGLVKDSDNVGREQSGSDSTKNSTLIEKLQIDQLVLSKKKEQTELAKIGSLLLTELNITEKRISGQLLQLSDLDSHIILDANRQLENLVKFSEANKKEDTEVFIDTEQVNQLGHDTQAPANLRTFSINKIVISKGSQVHFTDNGVQPAFSQVIDIEDLRLEHIDSGKPDQLTKVSTILALDEYSRFDAQGELALFADSSHGSVNAAIQQYSLPAISAYLNDLLGFNVLSGQLDNKLSLTLIQGKLEGKSKLTLRGLELESEANPNANKVQAKTAIPLNVALGMLKDNNGNVELSIPLSGSTNDPKFGVGGFVKIVVEKAIWSATQSYLLEAFVPYANVVSVLISATEYAMQLSFNDLIYLPEQVELESTQTAYAKDFINLMQSKPETQVKVCGVATLLDLDQQLRKRLPKEQALEKLEAISLKRGAIFKKWIISNSQIDPSRLLLCKAKVELKENAKPRIEISIP